MNADERVERGAIRVGMVGALPEMPRTLLDDLPHGDKFVFVAFSDEGSEEKGPEDRPAKYYPDYNVLLQDPEVELVLVEGRLDIRRDLAVRALNAGKHVVLPLPFAETAADAERIMKTAHKQGLVATAECPWRYDPDLLVLCDAVEGEQLGAVQGLSLYATVEPQPEALESLVDILFLQEEAEEAEPESLLSRDGLELVDQMHFLMDDYIKSVNAHLVAAPARDRQEGFMIYMSTRSGGWAVGQASTREPATLPRFVAYTAHGVVTASEGEAVVTTDQEDIVYECPDEVDGFWENLYSAVVFGVPLTWPTVDIVRAMKLYEAAAESVDLGEPIVI